MSFMDYIALIGAVAATARLITKEHGPFGIFQKFQAWVTESDTMQRHPKWQELLACPYCLAVWFAALYYGVWIFVPGAQHVLRPLGVVGWVYVLLFIQGY